MKFLLECVILEITEKRFRNREGAEQSYYVAQAYQPGIGVGEISISKDIVINGNPKLGKGGLYAVELRNGKPRITEVVK